MRTFYKLPIGPNNSSNPNYVWVTISTAANGDNSLVYIVSLINYLLLNLNESPFAANAGLPAHQSVMQQVAPDYYVSIAQQTFAPYFLYLSITKQAVTQTTTQTPTPTYAITCITPTGVNLNALVSAQGVLVDGSGDPIITGDGSEIAV